MHRYQREYIEKTFFPVERTCTVSKIEQFTYNRHENMNVILSYNLDVQLAIILV